MPERPEISFVCSVKDGAKDLERCAGSVLLQSMENLELLLVDDHSSDETWAVMESLTRRDSRVRAIRNIGSTGLTYALNFGLDFARGEFVARIDVDDFAHIERAKTQVGLLNANPEAAMAVGAYRVTDEEDWLLYSHCPPAHPVALKWTLCLRNPIRHSTATWRRSIGIRYDPSFRYSQDYEMWCRMSRGGHIIVSPEVVATIRQSKSSITMTKYQEQEEAADRVTSEEYRRYTGVPLDQIRAARLRLVHHMKCPQQFDSFGNMSSSELKLAMKDYIILASGFAKKEHVGVETMLDWTRADIESILRMENKRNQVLEVIQSAVEEENQLAIALVDSMVKK